MTEHDTDSLDCPCGPTFLLPCEEHEDNGPCWKCAARDDGCIELTREEAEHADAPLVIVHRDDDA